MCDPRSHHRHTMESIALVPAWTYCKGIVPDAQGLAWCGFEQGKEQLCGVCKPPPPYKNMRVFLFICVFLFFACSYF